MRRFFFILLSFLFFLSFSLAKNLLTSIPKNGATNVDYHIKRITIHFSKNMKMNSHSLVVVDGYEFPEVSGTPGWLNPRTFILPVKLKPGTWYGIGLNSKTHKNFIFAETGEPMPPQKIIFKTAPATEISSNEGGASNSSTFPEISYSEIFGRKGKKKVFSNSVKNMGDSQDLGHRKKYFILKKYRDRTENAFSILVPVGWRVEGGVLQIPPQSARTVIEFCSKKIKFSVVDPESGARVDFFPTEYYTYTTGPVIQFVEVRQGSILDGMIFLQPLSPSQFIRSVVVPEMRRGISNLEVLSSSPLPKVRDAFSKLFAIDLYRQSTGLNIQVKAEKLEFRYGENGKTFHEVWFSVINYLLVNNSMVWQPVFTSGIRAPEELFKELKNLLNLIMCSFRFNIKWYLNTKKRAKICMEKVAMTQREIIAIHERMVHHRYDTEDAISHELNLSLAGVDEYYDPSINDTVLIDNSYQHVWSNGNGEYVMSSDPNFNPNDPRWNLQGEWKRLNKKRK